VALPQDQLSAEAGVHRIGPNAVTRVGEALEQAFDAATAARLLDLAGLGAYVREPPTSMVDEREVTRLHQVLRRELGVEDALRVARDAGVRTGDYLLAHRIPRPVQLLLFFLPPRLAARVLMGAIARHSWTFAGSGDLAVDPGYPARLSIAGCCICRGAEADGPLCDFYAAALERLFRALVHRQAVVKETTCQAAGAHACTFEITW
jgi:divinyl protochlorophyllide a 8-vinyl-reductase